MAASSTEQFATLPVSTIQQVAISPDNTYVFVAMGAGGTATVPFNSANAKPFGAVGNIPVKNTGGAALSVAVDPIVSGANKSAPGLHWRDGCYFRHEYRRIARIYIQHLERTFRVALSTAGLAPYSILPISSGDYVYVANRQVSGSSTGVIAGFSIASTNSVYSLDCAGQHVRGRHQPPVHG